MEIIEASKKLITAQGTDLTLLYDDSLYRHCMNVARLSTQLGQLKGFDEHDLILLGTGSLLHDIGKIKLDNRILDKPGKLTDEEFLILQAHPVIGYHYLLSYHYPKTVMDIVLRQLWILSFITMKN